MAAKHPDRDARQIGKLLRDAKPVGEYRDRQRVEPDPPGELEHRGAIVEEHRRAGSEQAVGCFGDQALAANVILLPKLETQLGAGSLDDPGAAVNALDEPFLFKPLKIAPNGRE